MSSEITTNNEDNKSLLRSNSFTSSSSRFGTKSLNMFFTRNVAHPRNLRFITGVAGSQICSIKEDQYTLPKQVSASTTVLADPYFSYQQPTYDQSLINSYSSKLMPKRRKERALPPLSFWKSYGLLYDTHKWKGELNSLATSVGLMTSDELKSATERLQKDKNLLPGSPKRRTASVDIKPQTSEYSRETGRLNETPKPRTSRSSRGNPRMPQYLFCVENNEREIWMIQVLCQILQTESIQDIQSWLVSAGPQEKEVARELITKALQGLQDSGRIEYENIPNNNVNSNKDIQVDLGQIEETLKKMSEKGNVLTEPNLNSINEKLEVFETPNPNPEVSKQNNEKPATPAPSSNENVLQQILTKNNETKKPKTAALVNNTKYALFDPKSDIRPMTSDLFRSSGDSKTDKKLSSKIIKELVNFVEVERKNNNNSKLNDNDDSINKVPLFPLQRSASTRTKLTKIPGKDAQVLTIED